MEEQILQQNPPPGESPPEAAQAREAGQLAH
jgi:hypothetical protein